MSNPSKLGAICYEPEASFGENVATFTTLRAPVTGAVDASGLKHDKIAPERVVQRRQDGTQWILGNQSGTVKTRFWLAGHGSSTAGATALTGVVTLLGKAIGNAAVSAATGDTLTGGTASVPLTTLANGFLAGSLCRIGSLGDGKGNGQFAAIASHAANSLTLLTAIDGIPANGNVLYSAEMLYPSEDPINGTSVASVRLLLQTANLEYACHGCFATDIQWGGMNTNQVPYVEVTWTVAWWEYRTDTFPSAIATETFQPAANAGGTLFVNDVGTATRVKRTFRDFTLKWKLGVEALTGPGGIGQFQTIVGARRTIDEITVSWTEDADAATTTPVLPGFGTGTTAKHLLATMNPTVGKAIGIYCPNLCVTNVAVQKNVGTINRLTIDAMAYTGPTITNDLTASAIRIGFA